MKKDNLCSWKNAKNVVAGAVCNSSQAHIKTKIAALSIDDCELGKEIHWIQRHQQDEVDLLHCRIGSCRQRKLTRKQQSLDEPGWWALMCFFLLLELCAEGNLNTFFKTIRSDHFCFSLKGLVALEMRHFIVDHPQSFWIVLVLAWHSKCCQWRNLGGGFWCCKPAVISHAGQGD